jgi:acyl carrier protein
MESNVFDAVVNIFVQKLGVSQVLLRPEARLVEDIGMDSIDRVQLTSAVEREFHVRVPDEQIDGLLVVADIVRMVEGLRSAPPRKTTDVA